MTVQSEQTFNVSVLPTKQQEKIKLLRSRIADLSSNPLAVVSFFAERDLLRYLRARSFKSTKSEKMIRASLQWRQESRIDDLTYDDIEYPARCGSKRFTCMGKNGIPVIVVRPCDDPYDVSPDPQIKLFIYCIERCVNLLPASSDGKLYYLLDLKNWSMGDSRKVPFSKALEMLHVLQDHYPERMGKAFVVDAPRWFSWFFKALGPFIAAETRQKLVFVNGEPAEKRKIFAPFVDMDKLPTVYGGDFEWTYDPPRYKELMFALDLQHRAALKQAGVVLEAKPQFEAAAAEALAGIDPAELVRSVTGAAAPVSTATAVPADAVTTVTTVATVATDVTADVTTVVTTVLATDAVTTDVTTDITTASAVGSAPETAVDAVSTVEAVSEPVAADEPRI
eukprot:TRINITY_DN2122_c0_g1_i2.p1 TRINITY_DN2122_c0_g1~~TRINITY_DN2122_c0_g1_i2.p1  ORF type:complete len:462 (-),score=107.02 TRINITY_DN2122_c0_g1_i2:941-2122(-)